MKIYIWTDLEGVGGVVSFAQTGRDEKAEANVQACRWLTDEVNAAVEGALEAGAGEIIALDGHGMGFNFGSNRLHPGVRAISGFGRVEWLPCLDKSVDAVVMLGCHGMAGTRGALLEHTQSSLAWRNCRINGKSMGEIGQTAVVAGSLGVPIVFVSGDRAACVEAKKLLKDVETVSVKEGLACTCGLVLPPKKACGLITAGVKRALARLKDFKPYKVRFPVTVKIEAQKVQVADQWERNGWERIDGRTITRKAAHLSQLIP